ncbi:hypothetical protein EG329_013196 [Mollisiaceae sp. DMI_Dod_QoI]|nr:hypothetical protein EG329_013196 [Helotiales sp. DMI_Dod_QoI]
MDTPQRANAAQMAARNIKAAKGGRNQPRRPGTPSKFSRDAADQVPQFAPIPSADAPMPSQTGGLFGGTIQAPGTFSFSGPGGPFSFSKEKLGVTEPDITDTSDGRFAGDDRATKRQFGGKPTTSQSNTVFQHFGSNPQNNAFGASKSSQLSANSAFSFGGPTPDSAPSSSINFNAPQPSPTKLPAFTFGTSQSTPASPGSSFGSNTTANPTVNQSGNTSFNPNPPQSQGLFNFGSTTSTQQSSAPFQFLSTSAPSTNAGINFGSAPTVSAPATLFGNTPTSAPSSNSSINFGSTMTSAPTSSLFGNTQTSAPFSSSGTSFGTSSSTAPPMSNLFGTSAPPSSPSLNFGLTSTSSAFPSNLFGSGQVSQAPTAPSLFGATSQPPVSSGPFAGFNTSAPAQNSLGSQEQGAAPVNSLFGTQTSQSAQSINLFGNINPMLSQSGSASQSVPSITPTTNLFNSPAKPERRNTLFGVQSEEASQSNVVGNADNSSKSTNDLFGNLNKPVDASVTQSKVNGFNVPPLSKSSKLFGASKPLFSTSSASLNVNKSSSECTDNDKNVSSEAHPNNNTKNSQFSFDQFSPTKESSKSKNIFSASTSLDLPSTANQPPPRGMFPPLQQSPTKQNSKPIQLPQSGNGNMPLQPSDPDADMVAMKELSCVKQIPDSEIEKTVTPQLQLLFDQNPTYKREYFALYRLRSLNKAMMNMFANLILNKDPSPVLEFYMDQRVEILIEAQMYKGNKKRKEREEGPEGNVRPQKRPNQRYRSLAQPMSSQAPAENRNPGVESHSNAELSKAISQSGSSNPSVATLNDASYTDSTFQAGSSQTLNNLSGNPAKTNNVFPTARAATVTQPSTSLKGKRKAEDELTQNTEQVNPLRSIKTPKLNGSFSGSNEGSSTSAIFNNILNSPSKANGGPEKRLRSLQESTKDVQPRVNPFGNIPVPKSPAKFMAESSNQFKPAATPTPSQPNIFAAKDTAATSSANMFSIKGAAAMSNSNMFAPKDVPRTSQPNTFASTTASASPNSFSAKTSSGTMPANSFALKGHSATETPPSAPTANPFQLKPATSTVNGAESGEKSIKPPTFGSLSSSSAMEQFRQKAAKDAEAKEKKEMEEDKDNEWESEEETESDYERKWYARRAEQKKQKQQEHESLMKSAGPKFTFKPSQDASKSTGKDQDDTGNATNSLFAQSTARQASGNSAANSVNGSRTSTPGPIGSATGSVLDGHSTSQPVKNIFGHLSDTGSGKDGQDEESDADDEDDSENKDPNYFPSAENGSGPGTPAEETGAGIASAKKPNLFAFSNGTPFSTASNSGSSTPGRSLFERIGPKPAPEIQEEKPAARTMTGGLFDRIGRDSNGNPLRHISSEEKENTQPSTANVFGEPKTPFASLVNKTATTPADQTWKQDSPIKFGNPTTTHGQEATPIVSFTAATPTKTPSILFGGSTGSTSSVFGNKPATPSPFSGLLGSNSGNAKGLSSSGVGFAFGAAPSATSSLFPSTAGSAATSRGTSPGGTTDGASDVDPDPDAEHHEQIDLTAGGPGEENEEVVHEVRAKALRFETEDGSSKWVTAGLGPLRVLKHKESSVSRVLLRGDPSGKIILNKGILGNLTYSAEGKTVKFLASDDGKDLETFILQVKTPEFAQKLAEVLNENKAK